MSNNDTPNEPARSSTRRSSGRSPEALTALAGRIRALQRSEPRVVGQERLAALSTLTGLQLRLERLSLRTQRTDVDHTQTRAATYALAQDVDRVARLWPSDVAANMALAHPHRPPDQWRSVAA